MLFRCFAPRGLSGVRCLDALESNGLIQGRGAIEGLNFNGLPTDDSHYANGLMGVFNALSGLLTQSDRCLATISDRHSSQYADYLPSLHGLAPVECLGLLWFLDS